MDQFSGRAGRRWFTGLAADGAACREITIAAVQLTICCRDRVDAGGTMHHILLVDDDIALVEMIREFLEPEGFAVQSVHDGPAALQK